MKTQCPKCAGNGEIVTDWERYLHARPDDLGDEAVADCPECDGTGALDDGDDFDPEAENQHDQAQTSLDT